MAYSCSKCRLFVMAVIVMAAVVSSTSGGSSHTNHFYIKPTASEIGMECPPSEGRCNTLTHYITQNTTSMFSANTAIYFLPGIHKVNGPDGYFVIGNTQNITLSSYTNASVNPHKNPSIIFCLSQTMFVFFNVTNLKIKNLSFFYCGYQIDSYYETLRIYQPVLWISPDMYVAFMLLHVNSLEVVDLTISNSSGYGFLGINTLGRSYISHSQFVFSNERIDTDTTATICNFLVTEHGSSFCQGGNMLLLYVDPPECHNDLQLLGKHTLLISYSVFQGGVGTTSTAYEVLFPETTFPFVHGGGLTAMFFQQSYGFSLIVYRVASFRNKARVGANFFFLVSGTTTSTSIRILFSSTFEGHVHNISDVEVLKGSGLAFFHGEKQHTSLHTCPMRGRPQGNLFQAQGTRSFFNAGFEGAGTYIGLRLGNQVPHLSIEIANCTYLSNVGIIGAGLEIDVDLYDLGMFSVRENFLDPLQFYTILIKDTTFELNPPRILLFDYSHAILQNIQHELWKELLQITMPEHLSSYYYNSMRSVVFLSRVENVFFEGCKFFDNLQTGLLALHSMFTFNGSMVFLGNDGAFGGAISLLRDSAMYFVPGTRVKISNNTAIRGGGIYSTTSSLVPPVCFFQYDFANSANISVVMEHNVAREAGDDVYGGSIDTCITFDEADVELQFDAIFFIRGNSTLSISSAPERLCYCMDDKPLCSGEKIDYVMQKSTYPGGTFKIPLVPVGQRNGAVPGIVHAGIAYGKAEFAPRHDTQEIQGRCTEVEYSLSSQENFTLLSLLPHELTAGHPFNAWQEVSEKGVPIPFLVLVHFLSCPPGFVLADNSGRCVCTRVLADLGVKCNISGDNPLILRRESLWINLSLTGDDVIVHSHCPFDFCKSTEMWLDLSNPNSQCAFGHSGILCGRCNSKLSLTLGSSHCKKCSSYYSFLLLPFLLAGLALVLILIYCNITVSDGTVNGLIFYANIVRVNHAVFFQEYESVSRSLLFFQRFLSVFVAWLNLDLGIETCFYDGMDAYAHTWFQFTFPIYLWVIVGTMIILCHYSTTAVKMIGTNAVKVLATLFLLSYAKLQRTIITIFSFTYINSYYPDGSSHIVWLYDGNVPFLQGAHIPLFLLAVAAAIFFTIPFTLFVLFAPYIQKWSEHKPMRWIHRRFKPLLDAYQAPFKDKFRYWAGLMLVVRNILFVVFALNVLGNPNINLAVIITATLPLLMFSWYVHKSLIINVLETSFVLNLSILSAWTLYNGTDGKPNQMAVVCSSTGIAFTLFLSILLYHTRQQLQKTQLLHWIKLHCPSFRNQQGAGDEEDIEEVSAYVAPPRPVTCTYVELREPLDLLTNN